MPSAVFDNEVNQAIVAAQDAARNGATKSALVDGQQKTVAYPFHSPGDWRDCWIYFLMIDRFNNPDNSPNSTAQNPPIAWNQKYGFAQGGTFKGVQQQLGYIAGLGARAIWLSPVLKNAPHNNWEYNYHGYAVQDFLNVEGRFASDGTQATAERELRELIEEAHARGLYVILDIVLNHTARVFDYVYNGVVVTGFQDQSVLDAPLGQEPPIQWLDASGSPNPSWQDTLPAAALLDPDDAVWPSDLQRKEFFRRRGSKTTDTPPAGGFVRGDFDTMRQLVQEYDAKDPSQQALRSEYGRWPVLGITIRIHQYLIAKYDIDGFRIDTVKYVAPDAIRMFGNAMREFGLSIGKGNFFTFGEIADNEQTIEGFVGRNSPQTEGFGIDAALDFPLFQIIGGVVRGWNGVEAIQGVFEARKAAEKGIISSHGEAGRYFVSFLDNHDQNYRFNAHGTPQNQVLMAPGILFSLQGIPCLYYGTEQGLQGAVDGSGNPVNDSRECVREALWGKTPNAFDQQHPLYTDIKQLSDLRMGEPALRFGRLYFREVSRNGTDFGYSSGSGGIVAFSRILVDREVVVVANTGSAPFPGRVVVDYDLSQAGRQMVIKYSNLDTAGTSDVVVIPNARFYGGDGPDGRVSAAAALPVTLAAGEIQILVPA